MNLTTRVGLMAGASLALTTVSLAGPGTTNNNDDLAARLQAAEARIAELQSASSQPWLTEQRANEVRSLVQEVLADADTRASLLQSGMNAGWNNGFFIASSDGNFRLEMSGLLQVRYVYDWIDDDSEFEGADNHRQGFENTRTRLRFQGHVVNPNWTYRVQGKFDNSGGFGLEDGWIGYGIGDGWKLVVGQRKHQLLRESIVDDEYQLAVDRSFVDNVFSAQRTQGIYLDYQGDMWRGSASWNDGANSANGPALIEDVEWAMTARGEVKLAGNWDQFNDFTSWKGDEFGALIGGALHWQRAEFGTGVVIDTPFGPISTFNGNEAEIIVATLDAQIEFGGANLFGAFIYRDIDFNAGGDLTQYAVVVQGGFMFTDQFEGFARYEWADFDDGSDDLSFLTLGANYFFSGQQVKWTTDASFDVEDLEEIVFRSQLQLLF